MLAVTSPGFVLFAAVLAGLWFACPPPRRWQLMLGASLVFYAVLSWRTLPVLLASAFLVWWCARRAAEKGIFYAGLAAALLPLALLKYLPALKSCPLKQISDRNLEMCSYTKEESRFF